MDRPGRTFVKTITWQALGMLTMTGVGYAVTGSVGAGGSIAMIGAAAGVVFYVIHERIWARIRWGRD
jgi:uncharacterized membrane protein